MHRGGRFTALKKKKKPMLQKKKEVQLGSLVCFTSPSRLVTVNYFSLREMGTNEWQVHVKPSQRPTVGEILFLALGLPGLPCLLLVINTLPALRSSFVSLAEDIHIVC